MKQTMKRTLALIMALLLALPTFALSEEYAPAVEDLVDEVELTLGDDLDAGDEAPEEDLADGLEGDFDPDAAVPEGYVRVSVAVTPEDAVVAVFAPDSDEAIEPADGGDWLLVPGEYEYSAWAEGYTAADRETFEVPQGAAIFELKIALEPAAEITGEPAEKPAGEPTEEPAEEPSEEPTEEPAEEPTGEPATEATTPAEDTYAVEGKPEDIFGGEGADNTMVKGEDGKYTKSYTVDKAYTDASVVAVKNGTEKFGDKDGKEILFDLTGPGTFVVTFDPETKLTTVSGDIVKLKENPSDATSATGTTGKSSGGSSSSGSSSNSGGTNGAVQTGNASMAIIILLVLVSATAGIYFARRKVK